MPSPSCTELLLLDTYVTLLLFYCQVTCLLTDAAEAASCIALQCVIQNARAEATLLLLHTSVADVHPC
jgi:hypothetical protein